MLYCCAGPAAGAPDANDTARVQELIRAGAEAAKTKRWDACIESLTAASALADEATVWGDLGLCEEQAHRFAAAHGHLRRALESAPADPKKEPWKRYQAALVRVEERVALLIVTTDPPRARVILDGRPMGPADGRTFAVEPGTHTVAGRLDGYEDAVETRMMRALDVPNIHLQLKPKPKAPVPAARPMPSAQPVVHVFTPASEMFRPAWSPRGVLVTLAYAGIATAVVSGATAIGLEVHFRSMQGGLNAKGYVPSTCGSGKPPASTAECAELASRLGQRDTAFDFWIGATIASFALSGAAGLAMYLDRGPWKPKVTVTAGKEGGGVVVLGKW